MEFKLNSNAEVPDRRENSLTKMGMKAVLLLTGSLHFNFQVSQVNFSTDLEILNNSLRIRNT